jgi:hypothetical protein
VRFLVTTRPDAVGGSVLPALDATFSRDRGFGGVQHVALSSLRRGGGGSAQGGGGGGGGQVLVLRTVQQGCPEAAAATGAAGGGAADAAQPQLTGLYAAYGRVFDTTSAREAGRVGPRSDGGGSGGEAAEALPDELRDALALLMAAQEPLPLSVLQARDDKLGFSLIQSCCLARA